MNASGRFAIVLAVGISGLPVVARAQTAAAPRAPAARTTKPDTLKRLVPERSGRVDGTVFVADRAAITAGAIPTDSRELSAAIVVPEPVGPVNARLLDRDITAPRNHCRTDEARRKRVPPALIAADKLTLRWTIAGKGQVAAMDVVGSTPLDPGVLDCITRETNGWLFTAPVRGDVRLNRFLIFRRSSPAAPRP
jgi:hypothetical protein